MDRALIAPRRAWGADNRSEIKKGMEEASAPCPEFEGSLKHLRVTTGLARRAYSVVSRENPGYGDIDR